MLSEFFVIVEFRSQHIEFSFRADFKRRILMMHYFPIFVQLFYFFPNHIGLDILQQKILWCHSEQGFIRVDRDPKFFLGYVIFNIVFRYIIPAGGDIIVADAQTPVQFKENAKDGDFFAG